MSHEYYVLMLNIHGGVRQRAIVEPVEQISRAEMVASLREEGWQQSVAYIHHVSVGDDGVGTARDVTNEILKESGFYDNPMVRQ